MSTSQRIAPTGVIANGNGLWLGRPDGTSVYLLTDPFTQSCQKSKDGLFVAGQMRISAGPPEVWAVVVVPIDNPQDWQLVGDGHLAFGTEQEVHASNWVRGSGSDVVLLQGFVLWADGSLQSLPSCVYPCWVNDIGQVAYTYGEKQSLVIIQQGQPDIELQTGGIGDDAVAGPDTNSVWPYCVVRSYSRGQLLYDLRTQDLVPGHVPNPYANMTRVVIIDGMPWLVERTERITARPFNSNQGIVIPTSTDQNALDATTADTALQATWWSATGTSPATWQGLVSIDHPERLPRVDVITPPIPAGFPYTELPGPIDLGYYFYQWATDSQGDQFTTPAGVPCGFCYPLTWGELQLANAAKVPVMVETDGVHLTIGSGTGLRIIQRSDIYSLKAILGQPDAATKDVCAREGVTLIQYQDTPAPVVPADWPFWGVFAAQCYFALGMLPEVFVQQSVARLLALLAAGVEYLDVTFSAYDRNQPYDPAWLAMMQSCAGEICRRVPQVVSVSFFNGGRWRQFPDGSKIGGTYLYGLQTEHRKLKACIPAGPSRWPAPPPPQPPETDDMANLLTWAAMKPELEAACFCAGLNAQQTSDELKIGEQRFLHTKEIPTGEVWPPQNLIQHILVNRWTTLTIADCVDPKTGQPLTVSQISNARA